MLDNGCHRIIIVTHTFATGPAQKLEEFLKDKAETLAFIGHPFSYSQNLKACARVYKNGTLSHSYFVSGKGLPQVLLYLKDIFTTFYFVFRLRAKFDIYIGVNCLNAFLGLLLRQIGFTRRVIFYTIDYMPVRFENHFLNKLYHTLDRICVEKCDAIWNLSPCMAEMRKGKRVFPQEEKRQITVPIGTDSINQRPSGEIDRHTLVFLGHLREGHGLGLIIEAMEEAVKKVPDIVLKIIGTGPLEVSLKEMVRKKGLDSSIKFLGFIEGHRDIERILSQSAVGLAPYEPLINSPTRSTEPMKPKVYLSSGLPVIITSIPAIAYEISQKKAGIVIDYKKEELVKAILSLLTDDGLFEMYRKNAYKMASEYRWENIYRQALMRL